MTKRTDFSIAKTVLVCTLDLHFTLAPYSSPGCTNASISYSLNFSLVYGSGKTNPEVCGIMDFLLGIAFFFLMFSIYLQLRTVSSSKTLSMGMTVCRGFNYFYLL